MVSLIITLVVFVLARRHIGRRLHGHQVTLGPSLLERRAREGVQVWRSR